jgi:pimeloyl-ACP methyl ester carboxylesterase
MTPFDAVKDTDVTAPDGPVASQSRVGVVCLHANASSSRQWRSLTSELGARYNVLAPDLYDAGDGPRWPSDRVIRLGDEVNRLDPVLAEAGERPVLIGHSFGGAVALMAALANPGRVRALVLYEPVLFSLVDAETPSPNAADGIRDAIAEAGLALDAGDPDAAAERFIDYWMGPGAWRQTPEGRKPAIRTSIANVRRWGHAVFSEPTPLRAFRSLKIPVLCLVGQHTRPSAQAVVRLLLSALPNGKCIELEGLGHMGPVTHPDVVNRVIETFLRTCV